MTSPLPRSYLSWLLAQWGKVGPNLPGSTAGEFLDASVEGAAPSPSLSVS